MHRDIGLSAFGLHTKTFVLRKSRANRPSWSVSNERSGSRGSMLASLFRRHMSCRCERHALALLSSAARGDRFHARCLDEQGSAMPSGLCFCAAVSGGAHACSTYTCMASMCEAIAAGGQPLRTWPWRRAATVVGQGHPGAVEATLPACTGGAGRGAHQTPFCRSLDARACTSARSYHD